ncbi:MAG: TolC family protein [Bacteroidales bacterium]
MNKLLKSIALLLSLFITGKSAVAQSTWSLTQCINYAYENNLQLQQQKLNIDKSQNNILSSKLGLLPAVNASMSHNMNWGRSVNLQDLEIVENKLSQSTSASLSASLSIFEGFSKLNTIKNDKTQLEISAQQVEKLKNDLSISITRAYLQVLLAQEIEKTARASYKSVEEQVTRTKKLVDAGSQAYSTLLEIQAQLATEQVQLVTAQNSVRTNLLTLTQLLDIPTDTNFAIVTPDINNLFTPFNPNNITSIYHSALNLPEIKTSELSLESSKLALKIQKGAALPKISLSAGYGTYYSDGQEQAFFTQFNNNKNPSLGFGLSVPIFNGWRSNTSIRNARIDVKNSEIELKKIHQTLYKEIQQAYNDAISFYEKYKAAEQNMKSSAESFSYTEQKFSLGMLNGTDYTVAKTNLFKSQSEYYQTKFQYIFQLKILDFYKGIPITL